MLSSVLTAHTIVLFFISTDNLGITNLGIINDATTITITNTNHAFLSPARLQMLIQWILYVMGLCIFHLAEFFVTALYNPLVVNAESFVVNHSKSYTIAMVVSDK